MVSKAHFALAASAIRVHGIQEVVAIINPFYISYTLHSSYRGGLWVKGRALELDFFFDPSHLFIRPLFIGSLGYG